MNQYEKDAAVFRALCDPNRLRVLELLRSGEKCACVLLSDPRNKVYEVSDAVGYDNPKNFSRAFRSYFHMSPKEFREKGSQSYDET